MSPRRSIWCVQTDFWACGTFGIICAPILRQDYHYLEIDQNELPLEPCHLGAPSGASKIIYKPLILLVQIMHLSCTNTNTVSKRTEMRFHITHVTEEFHRVRPIWFLSLWYVWCKPCTYFAPTLTLSPNGLKWGSTWPTSPRRSIRSVQNDFWAYCTFNTNRVPILHQD
jgi:hypothetical protein